MKTRTNIAAWIAALALGAPAAAQPAGAPAKAEAAHRCLSLIEQPGVAGGFINACDFDVFAVWCAVGGNPNQPSGDRFNCAKNQGGFVQIAARSRQAAHTAFATQIFIFACRKDAQPRALFRPGKGFYGRCR